MSACLIRLPSSGPPYGAYTFTLEDTAGSGALLDVAVLGICGRQAIVFPEVADGDKFLVQADIQSPAVSECRVAWTAVPFLPATSLRSKRSQRP